ncbi:MAG: TetR family transcriptional regulator [bacterium]|nr:TetR family transcriptional regulator [bacterium]
MNPKLTLRQRNRLATSRSIQEIAVEMFEDGGFDTTTVEAVAAQAGVSPSTIYRLFDTKEGLVTWDERDSVIAAELAQRLAFQAPVTAFREAVRVGLAEREDLTLFSRRLRLMYTVRSVGAAAVEQDLQDRSELAKAFAEALGRAEPHLADDVAAGVCLAAVGAAVDYWQRDPVNQRLAELLDQAFAAIESRPA